MRRILAMLAVCALASAASAGEAGNSVTAVSARFGGTASAAAVRSITAEEASACATVLQTLRLSVKSRSLPTLQQLVTPALWGSITRDAGQALGSPEFFQTLEQETRERQPDPARDLYLLGLAQGNRLVLVFIMKAPAPTAEDTPPKASDLPGTAAAADEPIRTCQVLFEREPKTSRWQLAEARFEDSAGDYLRGENADAEMAELYKWAKFVGDPAEAPNPYRAKAAPAARAPQSQPQPQPQAPALPAMPELMPPPVETPPTGAPLLPPAPSVPPPGLNSWR